MKEMKIDVNLKDSFLSNPDSVWLFDELGSGVIYKDLFDVPDHIKDKFHEEFEILNENFLGDSKETYYQGMSFTRVIRRKSDDTLFGFSYWEDISKHGTMFVESNESDFGLNFEVPDGFDWDTEYYPSVYVFAPVTPFTVTGYETIS